MRSICELEQRLNRAHSALLQLFWATLQISMAQASRATGQGG